MSNCPFCGNDPYDYVDIGVGMQPIAVTCCEYGIRFFQYGEDEFELSCEKSLREIATSGVIFIDGTMFSLDSFIGSARWKIWMEELRKETNAQNNP